MISVVVLAGGSSNEREISLRSGTAVAQSLRIKGYKVDEVDPIDGLDLILPKLKAADIVFPVLHGQGGEDGSLQKQLEASGITYVGSSSQASRLCFNKLKYTELLRANGIDCPETELVTLDEFKNSRLRSQPFVLKPNDGGSSIDTYIVRDLSTFKFEDVSESFKHYQKMLLQGLIDGTEITVGILNQRALPVIEIVPPANQEFDYENKYNGATQELCPPEHVDQATQSAAQELAERIHNLTGCRDMSRTDIIVDNNQLFVLETNTIPGLTDQSLLPKAASNAGIEMPELVDMLIKSALKRKMTT